jgi:molybdopterin-binding protein
VELSARNQIPARIVAINAGEAIANVELDAGGEVTAVIKAPDVTPAVGD